VTEYLERLAAVPLWQAAAHWAKGESVRPSDQSEDPATLRIQ
jgi:hypothetical protein